MPIRNRRIPFAIFAAAAVSTGVSAEPAPQSTFIESVTVTAQKRAQNPIDVPLALTAYSGDFLEKVGIQEFDKLSLFVPGFGVQNQSPNNPGLTLRGLTLDDGDATQEPRVSVFEDDVSISSTRGTYIELFDIERIEIAKGPQTTLFGRAALMGGVNVIQNKADITAQHFAFGAEAGDYAYGMIEGMANVPLSDDFAVRLAGRMKSRKGYIPNLPNASALNGGTTAAGRVSFAWKPVEDFSADVIFNYEADHTTGTSFKSGTFAPADPATGKILGDLDHNSGAALATSPGFENNHALGLSRSVWDGKAILGYRLNDALRLTSITAYRRFDCEEILDVDGFVQPLLIAAEDERSDQFSHEFRINYDNGDLVTAFAGVDYFYSNVSQRTPGQIDERAALALFAGQGALLQSQPTAFFSSPTFVQGYAPAIIQGLAQALYFKNFHTLYAMPSAMAQGIAQNLKGNHWEQAETFGKTKSVDFYADATVHLGEQFELEGGVRYTHDDKTSSYAGKNADRSVLGGLFGAMSLPAAIRDALLAGLATPGAGSTTAIPPTLLPAFDLFYQASANNGDKISQNLSDNGLSWRFTGRYAVDQNTSFYASYARGRRPEVLQAQTPSLPFGPPKFNRVDSEMVNSYEIGAKTLALDGRLRADAAFYIYDYTNFQTFVTVNNVQVTTNAGEANAYGFETSVDWALTSWADFFGTYAYNRARFGGSSIYKGNKFRLNPDHKLSLGLLLRQKALGGTFSLLPTWTWQSKIFFDDNNDIASLQMTHLLPDTAQDELQRPYGLLDARLSYTPDDGAWSISVFLNNALNQHFIKDAGNTGDNLGIPTFIAGEPRFVGASLSIKML